MWLDFAVKRSLENIYSVRLTNKHIIVLHGTAGNATSPYNHFKGGKACSHVWIGYDGKVEQYLSGDNLSRSELSDPRVFSIECASPVDGSGKFTPEQVKSIIRVIKAVSDHFMIPLQVISSSKQGQRGIGWHRQGIDGNFPDGLLGGRGQRGGGVKWSGARGKTCPGDDRIRQIPGIVAQLVGEPDVVEKPSQPYPQRKWPYITLPATGSHTTDSHNAWVKLMFDLGYVDDSLTVAIQKWLRDRGFYHGLVDGVFGRLTVRALQSYLVARGFLPNSAYVDGMRGKVTVNAEISMLNHNRQFYSGVK